ncbi:radical SAM protein [uncultured Acetatifactor sp.]|uniref:radical SAM/SPASM domain-containing protein n=1 Tax=uncultured Acetatifactor sp. TaxID=1671927 RepID=UPI002630FF42|nr:radical SAM protein [uncultured Acetatifactor sp.]
MGDTANYTVLSNRGKYYLYDWRRLEIYEIGQEMYSFLLNTENMEKSRFKSEVLDSDIAYKEDIIGLLDEKRLFYSNDETHMDDIECPSCLSIMCGVGYSCNLDCMYCLLKDKEDIGEKEDVDIVPYILRLVGQVYDMYKEIKIVVTDGGEPFLFCDNIINLFHEIDKIDLEKKVRITVATNGTIYNQEVLDVMSEHDANIVFSLDGHLDNNKLRKSKNDIDNYALSVNNYMKFQEKLESRITKNIWAISVINAKTTSITSALVDFYDIGFRAIQFRVIKGMKDGVGVTDVNLPHFYRLFDELFDFFIKNIDDGDEKYLMSILNNGDFIGQMLISLLLGKVRAKRCLGAFSTISIDRHGRLYPCTFLNGQHSEEILSFNREDANVKKYTALNIDSVEKCAQCWASTACGGHCAYQSLKSQHAFTEPDECICKLTKYVLNNIIYLIDYVEEKNPEMYSKLYSFSKKRTYLYDLLW